MSASSEVPAPPNDPDVLQEIVEAGTTLFHGHGRAYGATTFNPGPRPAGRFSFFPTDTGAPVPAFYAGLTEEVAVAETFLHDVPLRGGQITWAEQELRIISAVRCSRELRLGQLHAAGLRLLELTASEDRSHGATKERRSEARSERGSEQSDLGLKPRGLTDTESDEYPRTVRWAAAIHATHPGLDGLVWMSARWNTSRAAVLFGDRVTSAELIAEPLVSRDFRIPSDREWLLETLDRVNVAAMPPVAE